MKRVKQFIVEVVGTFLFATIVFMRSHSGQFHSLIVALTFGTLLYVFDLGSHVVSTGGAVFNLLSIVANIFSGKWACDGLVFVAIPGQLIGTLAGAELGSYLHNTSDSLQLLKPLGINEYPMVHHYILGFFFSFLLCLIQIHSKSASEEGPAYAIVATSVLIAIYRTMGNIQGGFNGAIHCWGLENCSSPKD